MAANPTNSPKKKGCQTVITITNASTRTDGGGGLVSDSSQTGFKAPQAAVRTHNFFISTDVVRKSGHSLTSCWTSP